MPRHGPQCIRVIIEVITVKRNEMGGVCSTYNTHEKCIQGLIGGPEGNRPLGIPWSRLDDDNKKDLQGVG